MEEIYSSLSITFKVKINIINYMCNYLGRIQCLTCSDASLMYVILLQPERKPVEICWLAEKRSDSRKTNNLLFLKFFIYTCGIVEKSPLISIDFPSKQPDFLKVCQSFSLDIFCFFTHLQSSPFLFKPLNSDL